MRALVLVALAGSLVAGALSVRHSARASAGPQTATATPTDQEAMSVAFLQDRARELDAEVAALSSDRQRVYRLVERIRALDQTSEHLLAEVRARTGLRSPAWNAQAASWVEVAAPSSASR